MMQYLNDIPIVSPIANAFKRDYKLILCYGLLAFIMLLPSSLSLLTGDRLIASREETDIFVKLWDYWYLTSQLGDGNSIFSTNLLFYPQGTTLAFHNFNYIQVALMWFPGLFVSDVIAFNISVILIIIFNAYAGYLLLHTITDEPYSAFFGSILISFNGWIVGKVMQPEMITFFPLILAILFFYRATIYTSIRDVIIAGLFVGLASLASPYYVIFACWIFGTWSVYYLVDQQKWRKLSAWKIVLTFAILIPIVTSLRFLPMLFNISSWSDRFNKYNPNSQIDIIHFIFPSSHPFVKWGLRYFPRLSENIPLHHNRRIFYLGLIPLSIVPLKFISTRKTNTKSGLWGSLSLLFMWLSMGEPSLLGFPIEFIPSLNSIGRYFNVPLFTAISRPWDYFAALIIVFGIFVTLMLKDLMSQYSQFRTPIVIGLLSVGLVFELWLGPAEGIIPDHPDITSIVEMTQHEPVLIIPIGRQPSKIYLYAAQVQTETRLVEGMTAQTLNTQYQYINSNALTAALYVKAELTCGATDWQAAVDALLADGIRYIVVKEGNQAQSYFQKTPVTAQVGAYMLFDLTNFVPPC